MTATAKKPLLWQLLLFILGLYTLLEFYTFTGVLVVVAHYLVLGLCLAWLCIYPETPLIQPRNIPLPVSGGLDDPEPGFLHLGDG